MFSFMSWVSKMWKDIQLNTQGHGTVRLDYVSNVPSILFWIILISQLCVICSAYGIWMWVRSGGMVTFIYGTLHREWWKWCRPCSATWFSLSILVFLLSWGLQHEVTFRRKHKTLHLPLLTWTFFSKHYCVKIRTELATLPKNDYYAPNVSHSPRWDMVEVFGMLNERENI